MKLNMDRRRFLIRGIGDYERALDAIGLDSDESDESCVVDSEINVADNLDEYVPSPDASGSKISVCFAMQLQTQVKFRRKPSRHRCLPT